MKIYRNFIIALISLVFLGPINSFAIRLVDLNTSFSSLKRSPCVSADDIEKYGMASYGKGYQVNFHSEQQYIELLNKVYNCENQFTFGYFIYGKWEIDKNGKQKTIVDSIDRNWLKTWKLKNGLTIFGSFEEAVGATLYRKSIDKHGVDNIFIQRIDFEDLKEGGLLNYLNETVD